MSRKPAKAMLNAKQQLFIQEYLVDRNAARAARAARYSAKTARITGAKLLTKANIREAVDMGLRKQLERIDLKAAHILDELRKVAFVNIGDAFTPDGKLLPLEEMPADVRAALASVETDDIFRGHGANRTKIGTTTRIRLADKLRALELLGKHFKLFTNVQEGAGKDGNAPVVIFLPPNGSESPDYPSTANPNSTRTTD